MNDYLNSVWSNLRSELVSTGTSAASYLANYSFASHTSPVPGVKFVSRGGLKEYAISEAKRLTMKTAADALDKLYPKVIGLLRRDENLPETKETNQFEALIKNGSKIKPNEEDGRFKLRKNDGEVDKLASPIIVRDYLDRRVPEALILSCQHPTSHSAFRQSAITTTKLQRKKRGFWDGVVNGGSASFEKVIDESEVEADMGSDEHLVHYDISPTIQVQTSKNLVCTTVQGRDFTRKELISGSDLTFTINGSLDSMQPGIYPKDEVARLIKIASYNGIVQVYHYIFDSFNVKQIIIKDFQLGTQEFKNIQPYSITCIAVETEDEVLKQLNTIGRINQKISENKSQSKWYNVILDTKMASSLGDRAANTIESGVSKAVGAIFNLVLPNNI